MQKKKTPSTANFALRKLAINGDISALKAIYFVHFQSHTMDC